MIEFSGSIDHIQTQKRFKSLKQAFAWVNTQKEIKGEKEVKGVIAHKSYITEENKYDHDGYTILFRINNGRHWSEFCQ